MNSAMRHGRLWLRVWDALVWVLVLLPVLTGGIWIRRPGLHLELTDPGIPVLLLGLLGLLLRARFGVPLEEATSVQLFLKAGLAWKRVVTRRTLSALIVAATGVGGIWSIASLLRHWNLASHSHDLGIFTNAIWNLTHGYGYVGSLKTGINLFSDHQSPLFWLLAPLFQLFPAPETLLIAQGLGLAAGGIAIYFLAAQYIGRAHWMTAALPVLYWAYLPLRNANAFDFHPEVFLLPLFLAAITGLQSAPWRSRLLGALALLLALGAKESAGPVACGVGLAWALGAGPEATRGFTRRLGLSVMVLGFAVFIFDVKVVPTLLGGSYLYGDYFGQYGESVGEKFLAPLLKPEVFWPQLFGAARRKFLFFTLVPLAFLPLLNPRAFVAALPGYLMLFLSRGDMRLNLQYHYAIEPAVGLFWAVPGAVLRAEGLLRGGRFGKGLLPQVGLAVWVVFWAFAAFGRSEFFRMRTNWPTEYARWIRSEVVPLVSPERSVAASDSWIPQLSTRHWIIGLYSLKVPLSEGADCVFVDLSVDNWPLNGEEVRNLQDGLSSRGYREIWSCGNIRAFGRVEGCLSRAPQCLTPG